MQTLTMKVTGVEPLLLNNPQTVDPFNKYAKEKKVYTSKRSKTDEDLYKIREIEVESKLYFDDDKKIYIPASWVLASIGSNSWTKSKIKRADIRACVFATESKIKLNYSGSNKVKTKQDIVKNADFIKTMLLKQGQVKIAKCAPIFSDWSFETSIEYDISMIDESTLKDLITHSAMYGGYGDFRPTYGRAKVEFLH